MPAKRYAALLALCAGYSVLVTTASAWDYELAGAANANEWARAVVSDASGDVLAAGFTIGPSADAFTVVKLSGENGTEVWRRDINDNGGFSNEAAAVAVDGVGDVVAVGMLGHGGLTAIKFSGASGSELWRSSIHGTGSSAGAAFAVSLDSAGDVVVGGEIFNTGASGDWAIAKLSGTTGVEAWRHVVNGSANGLDYVYAVGVDSAGDVVASGSTNNLGTGQDFTVVKVAGTTGLETWRRVITGAVAGSDSASGLAFDVADNVVVVGSLLNDFTTGGDFTIVKLARATGADLWRREISGGDAKAVSVDAAGDVVAAGSLTHPTTSADFAVVKLSGGSGAELWRHEINGSSNAYDYVHAVALDPADDVVAAGYTDNQGTGLDWTVVKLSRSSGAELWRRTIDRAGGSDSANAVAVDGDGDVLTAGQTDNAPPGLGNLDFTVLKVRGSDGSFSFSGTTTTTSTALATTTTVTTATLPRATTTTATLAGTVPTTTSTTLMLPGRLSCATFNQAQWRFLEQYFIDSTGLSDILKPSKKRHGFICGLLPGPSSVPRLLRPGISVRLTPKGVVECADGADGIPSFPDDCPFLSCDSVCAEFIGCGVGIKLCPAARAALATATGRSATPALAGSLRGGRLEGHDLSCATLSQRELRQYGRQFRKLHAFFCGSVRDGVFIGTVLRKKGDLQCSLQGAINSATGCGPVVGCGFPQMDFCP